MHEFQASSGQNLPTPRRTIRTLQPWVRGQVEDVQFNLKTVHTIYNYCTVDNFTNTLAYFDPLVTLERLPGAKLRSWG
ncbi:MAG: hypothetical protein JWN70_1620 [Planctomycetaceae bacterium]|nr:hypothetical protein [Planctomycetaceae bacterium]